MKLMACLTLLISLSSFAIDIIPSFGMSCSSQSGYTLDIYPDGDNRLEFDLQSSNGELIDNNIHQYENRMDYSIHEIVLEGDDGIVSFSILGLDEESVSSAYIQYHNDVLDLNLHFNNCNII